MELAGAIFLPTTGYRNGTTVDQENTYGYYWSQTKTAESGYSLYYINTSMNANGIDLLSIWKRCLSVYSKCLDFIEIFDINSKLLANKKGITYKEPVVVFKKK